MIVLFVSLADAEALLRHYGPRREFASIARQLRHQLPLERVLPHEAKPILSYRFEDETIGEDIYDDALANRMYDGMRHGAFEFAEERRQQRLKQARGTR